MNSIVKLRLYIRIILFGYFMLGETAYAQIRTYFHETPLVSSDKKYSAELDCAEIDDNYVQVKIKLTALKNISWLSLWYSSETVISMEDGTELPILGFNPTMRDGQIKDYQTDPFRSRYGWKDVKKGEQYYCVLLFGGTPRPGTKYFRIIDKGNRNSTGFRFSGAFNNPNIKKEIWTEEKIKQHADSVDDGICGIYESSGDKKNKGYRLGCIYNNGEYSLIFLNSSTNMTWWRVGDIKARLHPRATSGLFKADWYNADKSMSTDSYAVFDKGYMKIIGEGYESFYLKMYPNSLPSNTESIEKKKWSGTGFALNNGYIVTNYHVVDDAQSINVRGIKGNSRAEYKAVVICTDKVNDLAIIKIQDSRFPGFGHMPYRIKASQAEVGEEIFVLGYPMTSTMGDEIKLTTGVISSRSGFQGDVSLYQISAPVQPGNSGGPLFDEHGNVIGIVSSKHTGAENVGYAIKASYLMNLAESESLYSVLPNDNTVSTMSLSGKVKTVKDFVFTVLCTN
jgi:S1-C subfamily serine protease